MWWVGEGGGGGGGVWKGGINLLLFVEGEKDVQILVNFSTLMDFLECALSNVTQEELVHPMHIVLDNWLYMRYLSSSLFFCVFSLVLLSSLPPHSTRLLSLPSLHWLLLLLFSPFPLILIHNIVYNALLRYVI